MAGEWLASFNPRPSSLTGEPQPASMFSAVASVFQSTPVITDGRTQRNVELSDLAAGFNPRPSSLTGEPYEDAPRDYEIKGNYSAP